MRTQQDPLTVAITTQRQDAINHNLKKTIKNKKFIITFYLGGGGNFNMIKNTIISLSNIRIYVLI